MRDVGRAGDGRAQSNLELSHTSASGDLTFEETIAEQDGTGLENTEPPL